MDLLMYTRRAIIKRLANIAASEIRWLSGNNMRKGLEIVAKRGNEGIKKLLVAVDNKPQTLDKIL